MPIFSVSSNLADLQARFATMHADLWPALAAATNSGLGQVAGQLSAAAPHGGEESGPGPQGDAPGPLSTSFVVEGAEMSAERGNGSLVNGAVVCTQPTKLRYVVKGTGIYGPAAHRIVPRTRRALAWPGAAHPYASVRGQPPNDFVTPVLGHAQATVTAAVAEAMRLLLLGDEARLAMMRIEASPDSPTTGYGAG